MLEPGSIVSDRYRVGRTLGKGGMGEVVEATHLQLGTSVALKILKKEADPASAERFLREARAAAKLRGEHICRVHDFGTLPDGAPYMVMELLQGYDLATVLKDSGPVEPGLLARYMLEACTAMAEAHAEGIVHRDLKPSNLFVVERPDGVPILKVLDFGIAKSIEKIDMRLTNTTNVMGSPAYMSPEQLKSSRTVDPRSDIWSLGVVMYELSTGKHPFNGETLTELAISIANDPIPAFPDHVPGALKAVIVKCMDKDPKKRYRDVAALAAVLEPLATHEHSVAGAIARRLISGVMPAVTPDGSPTAPSLPSNLAGPEPEAAPEVQAKLARGAPLARAISEVAAENPRETTTLGGASGSVAVTALERPQRWRWLAAGGLVAALVIVGITTLRGGDDAPRASVAPAAAPIVDPVPVTPAESPAAEPPAPELQAPAEPPPSEASAGVADADAAKTEPAATEPTIDDKIAPTTKPKVKSKRGRGKTTKPRDLSDSRY